MSGSITSPGSQQLRGLAQYAESDGGAGTAQATGRCHEH